MSESSGHAPLVWFTSLAIGGAGLIVAGAGHLPSNPASKAIGLTVGTIALGAGVLVSTLHLGRKSRAPLAARGRSALSLEIFLAGATLVASLALMITEPEGFSRAVTGDVASQLAVLFLLSIGRVYWLRGQLTWRGVAVLLPLTTGLVCGGVFLHAAAPPAETAIGPAVVLIWIDTVVFALRWRMLARHASARAPRRVPPSRIHRLSAGRLVIADLLPLALLSLKAAPVALGVVVVGLVFDRWLFYALADQHTTEAEIARVEAIIERAARIN